jgi:hypothetical protein
MRPIKLDCGMGAEKMRKWFLDEICPFCHLAFKGEHPTIFLKIFEK